MFRSTKLMLSCMIIMLILPGVVAAQPGGTRPTPSGSGGNVGGPGMSGAAFSFSMPEFSAPDVQQPDRSGGQTRSGGAAVPTRQPREGRSFDSQSGDLAARFGERGTGSFSLENFSGGWFSSFQQSLDSGGFGTRSEGWSGRGEHSFSLPTDELPVDLPDTPVALGDFGSLSEAQQAAQDSIQTALQQASDQAHQAADNATQQAQQAYDQFWQDYYNAVDTTAQTYYDTVSASADYLLQSYEQAVDYTTDAIDYYIAYADQYAAYCALYPWDCYSYVYDAANSVYVYVGDVSVSVSGTTEIGDVTTTTDYPVQGAPAPSADAYEALVVFANDQLGAVVEPLYAGVATADVQTMLQYLPPEIQAYFLNASTISGETYWGLMHGGAAAVTVGDCATVSATCAVNADNLTMQLSSASAGVYGLLTTQSAPANATDALSLITTVYPKLNGLSFAQISDVAQGDAFTATTASIGYDPATGMLVSVAKIVYTGVIDVDGQAFVYAMVALGEGHVGMMGS